MLWDFIFYGETKSIRWDMQMQAKDITSNRSNVRSNKLVESEVKERNEEIKKIEIMDKPCIINKVAADSRTRMEDERHKFLCCVLSVST